MDVLSFGNQLRLKRQERQLSVEDVADQLRLKKQIISAIEEDNHHLIPPAYLKGYLRAYAKVLLLPENKLLNNLLLSTGQTVDNQAWIKFSSDKQVSVSNKFFQWITFTIISGLVVLVTLWWKSDNLKFNLQTDLPMKLQAVTDRDINVG